MHLLNDLFGSIDPLALLVRATVLLGVAALFTWFLRGRAASTRHLLWTATFGLLLGLPLAVGVLPGWEVPLLPMAGAVPAEIQNLAIPEDSHSPPTMSGDEPGPARQSAVMSQASGSVETPLPVGLRPLALVWGSGSVAVLLSLLVGWLRLRRQVQVGRAVSDAGWLAALDELRAELGIEREVRLIESSAARTPMTAGWRRPVILLPEGAHLWSANRRRVVLTHELVHVRRFDALRQVLGRVALSLYWFHPLSLVAARLSVVSREQACDEAVLDLGTKPSEYARHLFDLAAGGPPRSLMLSLPLVQRSTLEKRIMAILRPTRPRSSRLGAALVSLALVLVAVGATVAVPVPVASAAVVADADSIDFGLPSALPVEPPTEVVITAALAPERRLSLRPAGSDAPDSNGVANPSCRMEGAKGTFKGSFSPDGDRVELSGWYNGDRVLQKYDDNLRLCMRLHGEVVLADDRESARAVGEGSWAALETEDDQLWRLVITEGDDGIVHSLTVDGRDRPFDSAAREWRDRAFRVLELFRQASALRGEESSLRGRISSHRGHVSSLRGQISSYRGHVSSLGGQISSHRGQVSSLRGQISSLRGHVSSLRGQSSSYEGQISSLRASSRSTKDAQTRARLEREIGEYGDRVLAVEREVEDYQLESRVAAVQREIDAYDLDNKVAEVQRQIEAYGLDRKVEQIERKIEEFDLDGKVREVEREIEVLDAERRAKEIERRVEPELNGLRRLLRAQ